MSAQRHTIYERLNARIVEAIGSGASDFRPHWLYDGTVTTRAVNIANGKRYRGANVLALWADCQLDKRLTKHIVVLLELVAELTAASKVQRAVGWMCEQQGRGNSTSEREAA